MNEDCMVRYFPQSFPAWGVLIDENNQIVNSLNIECSKFKTRGFRYKHKKWPSPNRDFIPVTVELISNPSEWVVKSERHFIQGRVRRDFVSYRVICQSLLSRNNNSSWSKGIFLFIWVKTGKFSK